MNTKRKTLKMPVRYLMNAVLVALLFVGLSYLTQNVLSTYQNKVLLTVGINIILAVSLNVATGYLGQLPLGHAGFMAVGAYTCALFTMAGEVTKGTAAAIYLSGLPVNAVHALATALTIWLLSGPLLDKLGRIRLKYGLMEGGDAL